MDRAKQRVMLLAAMSLGACPTTQTALVTSRAEPSERRTPVVRGRLTAGWYAPGQMVGDARVALAESRRTDDGSYSARCSDVGLAARIDSLGHFRLPSIHARAYDALGTSVRPAICLAVAESAWYLVADLADTSGVVRDTLWLDCLVHGERGSPECARVTREALGRAPVRR